MPADKAFLDTNILVYAFHQKDRKKSVAGDLMVAGGTVAVQTLNEFVNVAVNEAKEPWAVVLDWLRVVEKLCPPPLPLTRSVHYRGLQISQTYGYHIYDSLMLAAALEDACTVFYTEDMHDGQTIGGMTIRNPF